MNKMKKNYLMFAALVATTLGFTACSSDDGLASAEQEERGVVKTEFTIAFPQKAVAGTRMAAGNVQLNPSNFRGISGMKLYPFIGESINGETVLQFPQINLYDGTVANILVDGNSFYKSTNSHLYQDVDIPIGTKTFMFYGVASKTNELASVVGALIPTEASVNQALSVIKFSPSPICSNPPVDANGVLTATSNGGLLATYLTSIAVAQAADDNVWATTVNVPLKSLYEKFITMKAGSWTNAMAVVSEIYDGVKTALSSDNDKTVALKSAIKTAILANANVSEGSGGALSFTEHAFGDYPNDLGLPDGAAYILWNGSAFEERKSNGTSGWNMADFEKYAYPAELYYHVISNLKTSTKSESSHYTGDKGINTEGTAYTNWKTLVDDNYKDGGSVTSATRSIAIVKQVQYAVGRLDVKVQASSSLKDNAGANVTIGTNTFKVTGLLVNGQKAVDYKFNQLSTEPSYTLYDKVIKDENGADVYMTTSTSNPFYTLVLETPAYGYIENNTIVSTNDTKEAAKVRIAVEFLNKSGQTLVGRDGGLIYPNTKFYLIGTLDPSKNDGVTSTAGHTNCVDANNELIMKAFMQDYNTTVTLEVTDLTKAYNVLPDLSLPKLELGLSVDVDWKSGITQTLDIE